MKHNRLNALHQKLWVLALTLILAITLPGFVAAMDLGGQLGDLQSKLVGLKGKLGQLKGGLEKLKDALDGKAPSGGGSGLTVNSGLGALDWVQVLDVESLKKAIVAPPGAIVQIQGAVIPTQRAITALTNLLSSPDSKTAETSILAELDLTKIMQDNAILELPRFEKNLKIVELLLPIKQNLDAKKDPLSKIDIPTKRKLESLQSQLTDPTHYAALETLLSDINDIPKRKKASDYIQKLIDTLVGQNPNMEKNRLKKFAETPLLKLQQDELEKYVNNSKKLYDDINFSALNTYKKTFLTIIAISEALSQKIGANATGDDKETPDTIKNSILNKLKDQKLTEIKTDNVDDLASFFTITLAQIKDPLSREQTGKAVFDEFIDSRITKDKALSRENLAQAIVRLNLDLFIKFENFPDQPSQNKAKFNAAFDSKLSTANVEWYDYFKQKIDSTIASINPALGSKLKNVQSWVTDGNSTSKIPWKGRSEKPLQALHVGLSEAEKENRAVALRGLIGTFSAANIINDAKTLCDNMAGIDKLTADEKTSLRDKIILLTTKADLDKINKPLERGNLSVILKRLGATNEQITDRGLALPSEKPPSGPKKSSGSTDATDTKTSEVSDVETAKTKIRDIIIAKLPTPPPPPPPPGSPWDVSSWKELDDTEIQTIIDNRSVITSKPPIHPALKPVMEKQKAKFSGKGADGLAVLTALGITP
jgi:hypothetical protein